MIDKKSLNELKVDIQTKRSVMYSIADQYGFSDERTLKYSQELDELIVEYQNYMRALRRKKSLYMKIYYPSCCSKSMKFKV